jgi:hypothetical protein
MRLLQVLQQPLQGPLRQALTHQLLVLLLVVLASVTALQQRLVSQCQALVRVRTQGACQHRAQLSLRRC